MAIDAAKTRNKHRCLFWQYEFMKLKGLRGRMGNSIFKNFSVDDLCSSGAPELGLGHTPHLFLLARDALRYCGTFELDGNAKLKGFNPATDDSLTALISNINALANLALENQTEIRWAGFEGRTKKVGDCTVFELAFEGLSLSENSAVSHSQISGIAALWLIDNAITVAKSGGISLKSVETLSEAALFLSQASMVHKDIYQLSAERNEASRKDVEFVENQSKKAAQNAAKRHANDPKQQEKNFIYECWCDWQKKPKQYESNAAFARAMVDKCERITSHKNITNWCTTWNRQN